MTSDSTSFSHCTPDTTPTLSLLLHPECSPSANQARWSLGVQNPSWHHHLPGTPGTADHPTTPGQHLAQSHCGVVTHAFFSLPSTSLLLPQHCLDLLPLQSSLLSLAPTQIPQSTYPYVSPLWTPQPALPPSPLDKLLVSYVASVPCCPHLTVSPGG